jgi:hypothetical protein
MTRLVALLLLVGCTSAPPPPQTAGASSTGAMQKGDPVAIVCERDGWAAIQCTAINAFDYTPVWTTFVNGKPVEHSYGQSVALGIGSTWTLVQMVVTDGKNTITLYLWALRPTPTSAPLWKLHQAGDWTPTGKAN